MNYSQDQFRQMIDEIPTLAWSCLPDGSSDHCADSGQAVEPDRIPNFRRWGQDHVAALSAALASFVHQVLRE